jgi:ribosomal-protein-alanine N-acetyltransferase
MKVLLSKMSKEDIDSVFKISSSSFFLPWSKHSFELELDNVFAHYVIAKYEN